MMQREGRWPDFTKHVPRDLAIPFLGISLTEIHARRFTYQDLAAVGSETNVRLPGCSEVTEKNGERGGWVSSSHEPTWREVQGVRLSGKANYRKYV